MNRFLTNKETGLDKPMMNDAPMANKETGLDKPMMNDAPMAGCVSPVSFPEAISLAEIKKEELAKATAYNDEQIARLKAVQRAERLDNVFSYHPPTEKQQKIYSELRYLGQLLASFILEHVPDGADQSAALRKVREAVMTANAGIACGGKA